MNKKPEELAEEYVNLQIKRHPRQFPEWSKADVEIAYYSGYESRDEEVEALKQEIKQLQKQLNK